MNKFLRPTLFVTAFSLAGMIVGFFIQTVTANFFGATGELDAYLAASTLPQYVIAVLTGSLGVVFIPVFIDYLSMQKGDQAWEVASSVINITSLGLLLIAIAAILFSKPIVRLAFPGLSDQIIESAAYLARILWPSIIFSGWICLLTGIYQVQGNFIWPALVNIIGLATTLALFWTFEHSNGIIALAWSTLIGLLLQAILLAPVLLKSGGYKLILGWRLPGTKHLWSLLWPLLFSGFFIRASIIVDRYVSSSLPSGSISHLGYANKMLGLISVLVSTGVATVLFPRMANSASLNDMNQLKNTLSGALRMIWLVVAPTIALLVVLSVPIVSILLQRGAFTAQDSKAVGFLLSWYAISLVGASFGAMTGRVFYVLQDTKTLSIMGILEMLGYMIYTPVLAGWYGTMGVAIAYGIYFTASISWHAYYIWNRLGRPRANRLIGSFFRTAFCAMVSGLAIWIIAHLVSDNWSQVMIASSCGICGYILLLKAVGSKELNMLIEVSGIKFANRGNHLG